MVFIATFINISVITWWSILLVEEIGVTGENHQLVASHWKLYHIMLYRLHLAWTEFELTTLVMISIDCTDSCKSDYHTITTMTALMSKWEFRRQKLFEYKCNNSTNRQVEQRKDLKVEQYKLQLIYINQWCGLESPAEGRKQIIN